MNKEFRSLIEDIKERYGMNQGEIAKRLGVTRQYISVVIGGGAPVSDALKKKILEVFPEVEYPNEVSDSYLPVVENAVKLYLKSNGMTMQDMADRLGVTQQAVSFALKSGMGVNAAKRWSEEFGFNVSFLTTGQGQLTDGTSSSQEIASVPLLPVFAQAGHLTGWSEGINEYDCERVISPIKDVDMAVHIYGESMSPDIPNGSVVYVKRINPRVFIEWGKCFILDTVNGPLIKYLAPGHNEGFIKCVSANPDPIYAPFEVSKEDVTGIYKVVMCMAMK